MSDQQTSLAGGSAAMRFWLRLIGWLALYGILLVPWGLYNRWPENVVVAVCYLPICLAVAVGLGRRHRFGLETPEPPSHWEL